MKIGIIGSRQFSNYDLLKETVLQIIGDTALDNISFVSGGAKGADTLAEKLAEELNIQILVFKPDYKKFRKGAPLIRNKDIVSNSDIIVAFPVGESRGTYYTIKLAREAQNPGYNDALTMGE